MTLAGEAPAPDAVGNASVGRPLRIAHLSPELPALSQTFVYKEILALEAQGIEIVPVSVRAPAQPASGQSLLQARTHYLYEGSPLLWLLDLARALGRPRVRVRSALALLARDLRSTRGLLPKLKRGFQCVHGIRLARLIDEHDCDALHLHFVDVPLSIAGFARAARPVVLTATAHANDLFERNSTLAARRDQIDHLVTISRFNFDHLVATGFDPERLSVIPCGVDLTALDARSGPTSREPGEPLRIGSLGRLVEKKGFDVLIDAFARLDEEQQTLRLEIVGDGPLHDSLAQRVAELGLSDRLHFLGPKANEDALAWLASLDVFALACRVDAAGDMDGLPVVIMEAMALGIPVATTRLSGIPELVRDEETGLLAEPGERQSFSEALARLVRDPDLRDTLAASGRAAVERDYDLHANAARLARTISGLVEAAGRNAKARAPAH